MSKEKEERRVLFTAIVNEKTGDLLLEIGGDRDKPSTTTIEFWGAFLKDFDRGEVEQQFDELGEINNLIRSGLEKMERILTKEEENKELKELREKVYKIIQIPVDSFESRDELIALQRGIEDLRGYLFRYCRQIEIWGRTKKEIKGG